MEVPSLQEITSNSAGSSSKHVEETFYVKLWDCNLNIVAGTHRKRPKSNCWIWLRRISAWFFSEIWHMVYRRVRSPNYKISSPATLPTLQGQRGKHFAAKTGLWLSIGEVQRGTDDALTGSRTQHKCGIVDVCTAHDFPTTEKNGRGLRTNRVRSPNNTRLSTFHEAIHGQVHRTHIAHTPTPSLSTHAHLTSPSTASASPSSSD